MIFLSLKDNVQRFIAIKETTCVYQEYEDGDECGNITVRALNMPFEVPPMPLCYVHAYEFRDWTNDDTVREFVAIMTEDDVLKDFLEKFNDDSK